MEEITLTHKRQDNMLFLKVQTPAEIGVCLTCAPDRIQFLKSLMDMESEKSCFHQGHEVERLSKLPDSSEKLEYQEWKEGALQL